MSLTARDYSFDVNEPIRGLVGARESDRSLYWVAPLTGVVVARTGERREVDLDVAQVRMMLERMTPYELLAPARTTTSRPILVEHTSANPVHPLHLGSFRGSLIGATLSRLLRLVGHSVRTAYFVNDLGRQVDWALSAISVADMSRIPAHIRFDRAVGVLYAAANMLGAKRVNDYARLSSNHSWLFDVFHDTLPAGSPRIRAEATSDLRESLVSAMVELAASDLELIGADVDCWEYESTLPALTLYERLQQIGLTSVTVNDTTCVSSAGGIIPLIRPDGTPLYFAKDVQNLLRREPSSRIIHVVGSEQTLLQQTLSLVGAAHGYQVEHVRVGSFASNGKRSSARQDRLEVVRESADALGPAGFRDLCLRLVAVPAAAPANLPFTRDRRIDAIGRALDGMLTSNDARCATGDEDAALNGLLLRVPGLIISATQRRAPHVLVMLAARLAAEGLRAVEGNYADGIVLKHTDSILRTLVQCVVGTRLAQPRTGEGGSAWA